MEWYTGGILIGISILVLLAMRMPLGFVFGTIGAGGLVVMTGNTNILMSVVQNLHDMLSDFVLITIPLFVLMAELLSSAGFIPDLYESIEKFTGRVKGSIAFATIVASAIFAAVCGSSYVTAATLAKMTIPEMLERGYKESLTTGSVAAGGTLGILIPPSLAMVIYGYMSGASIAKLFIAGIVPGILLTLLFIIIIGVWVNIDPKAAVRGKIVSWGDKFRSGSKTFPVMALAIFLLVIIYMGITTPAEAAAMGCIFALGLCVAYGRFRWKVLLDSCLRTIATSGFLLLLMGTAKVLAFMVSKAGIMYGLQEVLSGLSLFTFIIILYITISILGLFLEGTSILVLTTPIFAPAMTAMGLNLIWYGVILVLFIEIAMLTPPVGMNCYIVAEVGKPYGIRIENVFRGITPFLIALLLTVILITLFPKIALWLPSTM
jgi:tripartite ATP-independent transporter DctM subunit